MIGNRLLEGKNIVITGCNRGIGKAVLTSCALNGANVKAVIRKESQEFQEYIQSLAAGNDVNIDALYADFSDEEQVKAAARSILSDKVRIDGLVNNIGVAYPLRSFAMTRMELIKSTFEVNLFSQMFFTQQLIRNMQKERQGSIVFISSSAAYDGGANIEYSASKAAIIGEVRRLAVEYGDFRIRVNAVAPGLTDTDMGNMDSKDEEIALSMNIMRRKGRPEEIAGAVLFLLADMSSFVTSQVLRVDGGLR